jgi:hypothetical protein
LKIFSNLTKTLLEISVKVFNIVMDENFENYFKPKKMISSKAEINLGKHETHDWQVVRDVPAPHSGKIICNTCGGKWVTWLPKGAI